jgi:sodium-dependent dicarboxylate transporter 2/3/5
VLALVGSVAAGALVYGLLSGAAPDASSAAPGPAALSPAARALAAIFAVALVLWATEVIPIAVTALLLIILPPLLGAVPSLRGAAAGYTTPVVFFVLGSYCLAFALSESGLGRRFALWLFLRSGTRPARATFAVMLGSAVMSTVVSDVPTCSLWMALVLPMLTKIDAVNTAPNLGKILMMGIPIASLIGGVATPAGSSVNVLGLDLLKRQANIDITFLQWTAIGVPMVAVLVPFAWYVLIKLYPPEVESIGDMGDLRAELTAMGRLTARELKALAILTVMVLLWVLSSWLPGLDVTTVCIGGAVAMFLPGIRLIEWKSCERYIGWQSVLMIGSVSSLGIASSDTGLSAWLVTTTLGGVAVWPAAAVVAAVSAFTVVLHLPIPVAPAIAAVLVPAVVALAKQTGMSSPLLALPVAFTASCAFLLPLDAVALISYSKGYYRMRDMFLPGAVISLAWILIMTLLMMTVAPRLGLQSPMP